MGGEEYVLSDAGYRTSTTITIINGVLDSVARGLRVEAYRGSWVLYAADKAYAWGGTLIVPKTGIAEGFVHKTENGDPFKEGDQGSVDSKKKQVSKCIDQDIEKIIAKVVETGDFMLNLSELIETDKYGFEYSDNVQDIMYEYAEKKGYRNPDAWSACGSQER